MRGWLKRRGERRKSGSATAAAASAGGSSAAASSGGGTAPVEESTLTFGAAQWTGNALIPTTPSSVAEAKAAKAAAAEEESAKGEAIASRVRAASTIQPWHRETEDDLRRRLGGRIFTQEYDAHRAMLTSLPPSSEMEGADDVSVMAEWFADEMMRVDVDRDRIKSRLSRAVMARSDDFLAGLRGEFLLCFVIAYN